MWHVHAYTCKLLNTVTAASIGASWLDPAVRRQGSGSDAQSVPAIQANTCGRGQLRSASRDQEAEINRLNSQVHSKVIRGIASRPHPQESAPCIIAVSARPVISVCCWWQLVAAHQEVAQRAFLDHAAHAAHVELLAMVEIDRAVK